MKAIAGVVLGLVLAVLAGFSDARASCSVTVYADRAYTDGSTTYVWGRMNSLDSAFYFGVTQNSTLASLIFSATAQHSRILITGNVSTCPTSGTSRYVGILFYAYLTP